MTRGIDHAFTVFTERFGDFKPPEHNLLGAPIAETVFEPRVGGHIVDRAVDGSECRWARILAFDPPDRVVFSWDISPQWRIETDPDRTSEVEVRFYAEAPERTRVELEHRHLDRHGPGWEAVLDGVDGDEGWPLYLARYAALLTERGLTGSSRRGPRPAGAAERAAGGLGLQATWSCDGRWLTDRGGLTGDVHRGGHDDERPDPLPRFQTFPDEEPGGDAEDRDQRQERAGVRRRHVPQAGEEEPEPEPVVQDPGDSGAEPGGGIQPGEVPSGAPARYDAWQGRRRRRVLLPAGAAPRSARSRPASDAG